MDGGYCVGYFLERGLDGFCELLIPLFWNLKLFFFLDIVILSRILWVLS
jgi:hypothetical protein